MSLVQAVEQMEEEIVKLKQERDELAAQVVVKDAALQCADKYLVEAEGALGGGDDELNLEPAILQCREALSITPPAALREIQARALEEAAGSFNKETAKALWYLAAAKRKGE